MLVRFSSAVPVVTTPQALQRFGRANNALTLWTSVYENFRASLTKYPLDCVRPHLLGSLRQEGNHIRFFRELMFLPNFHDDVSTLIALHVVGKDCPSCFAFGRRHKRAIMFPNIILEFGLFVIWFHEKPARLMGRRL
jgi:hypothetical protein